MPVIRLLAAAGVAVAFVACGGGSSKDKQTRVTTTNTAGPGTKNEGTAISLKARLAGADEVPGPGVKDGTGAALVNVAGTQACYDLKATMGEKPTGAHIHRGPPGQAGPVVVDFRPTFTPGETAFEAKSCVDLPAEVAQQLIANPGAFYVNVHSDAHPDGAMRGQLAPF
ncbi:MAG TPA: CHRD domain-containing protein [Acidimicrobiia bacterium]|nr:CHRD domain-containing protein [Acidimicrobiia bacterium]